MNPSRIYLGAAMTAVAGILFWTLTMPFYNKVGDQRVALEERNAILENRNSIISNINELAKEYKNRADDINKFSAIVPSRKSVPELVSSIQALASQNGLQLTGLSLGSDASRTKDSYEVQSIDLGLSGYYPSFKSFLNALESNLRVIDITTIDANPATENSPIISFRIKANAYYLK